jgi:hypothetical protein
MQLHAGRFVFPAFPGNFAGNGRMPGDVRDFVLGDMPGFCGFCKDFSCEKAADPRIPKELVLQTADAAAQRSSAGWLFLKSSPRFRGGKSRHTSIKSYQKIISAQAGNMAGGRCRRIEGGYHEIHNQRTGMRISDEERYSGKTAVCRKVQSVFLDGI